MLYIHSYPVTYSYCVQTLNNQHVPLPQVNLKKVCDPANSYYQQTPWSINNGGCMCVDPSSLDAASKCPARDMTKADVSSYFMYLNVSRAHDYMLSHHTFILHVPEHK